MGGMISLFSVALLGLSFFNNNKIDVPFPSGSVPAAFDPADASLTSSLVAQKMAKERPGEVTGASALQRKSTAVDHRRYEQQQVPMKFLPLPSSTLTSKGAERSAAEPTTNLLWKYTSQDTVAQLYPFNMSLRAPLGSPKTVKSNHHDQNRPRRNLRSRTVSSTPENSQRIPDPVSAHGSSRGLGLVPTSLYSMGSTLGRSTEEPTGHGAGYDQILNGPGPTSSRVFMSQGKALLDPILIAKPTFYAKRGDKVRDSTDVGSTAPFNPSSLVNGGASAAKQPSAEESHALSPWRGQSVSSLHPSTPAPQRVEADSSTAQSTTVLATTASTSSDLLDANTPQLMMLLPASSVRWGHSWTDSETADGAHSSNLFANMMRDKMRQDNDTESSFNDESLNEGQLWVEIGCSVFRAQVVRNVESL